MQKELLWESTRESTSSELQKGIDMGIEAGGISGIKVGDVFRIAEGIALGIEAGDVL